MAPDVQIISIRQSSKAFSPKDAFELCRMEMICTSGATPENPSAAGAGGGCGRVFWCGP
ncbi:hypothetical protein MAHJHV59_47150 [Mycobacterium avium subsp. hominissuis]